MSSEVEQKVDHVAAARGALQWMVGDQGPSALADDPRGDQALWLAQAHAQIAIAEELRGIREGLEPPEQDARLADVLSDIRGIVLGNGPKGDRNSLTAINELVGYALYGDFTDSEWVKRHREGGIG